jgi:hypothetical protein
MKRIILISNDSFSLPLLKKTSEILPDSRTYLARFQIKEHKIINADMTFKSVLQRFLFKVNFVILLIQVINCVIFGRIFLASFTSLNLGTDCVNNICRIMARNIPRNFRMDSRRKIIRRLLYGYLCFPMFFTG